MIHADHVALLEGEPDLRQRLGLPLRDTTGRSAPTWADLGSGDGAFTLALADLLGPGAEIFAIDRDPSALGRLSMAMRKSFPNTLLHTQTTDFTRPLNLPLLDGIVMANSLHFLTHPAKTGLLTRLRAYFRPGGQLILVEYNADRGNIWVPYPLSLASWQKFAAHAGYTQTTRLGGYPSRFMGEIFSTVSLLPAQTAG
ncbi:MAG: class I SAM-dependent methyltransferase [Anaerolineaceae bacterium]|nr:class I SAM-dependent methyltransferase [Anaerolineaceae bacterium]